MTGKLKEKQVQMSMNTLLTGPSLGARGGEQPSEGVPPTPLHTWEKRSQGWSEEADND